MLILIISIESMENKEIHERVTLKSATFQVQVWKC